MMCRKVNGIKWAKGTSEVGMGRGSHTVQGMGDEYIARFKHSYLQVWVLQNFCQITMDQSSSVMSAKPSAKIVLFLVSASRSFRISRSSLFQIARSSSCCASISLTTAVACSPTPNPLKISSVLTPSTKETADDEIAFVLQLKEVDRPRVRRPVLEGVEGPLDSFRTIPRVSNMLMMSVNSILETGEKASLDLDRSLV